MYDKINCGIGLLNHLRFQVETKSLNSIKTDWNNEELHFDYRRALSL